MNIRSAKAKGRRCAADVKNLLLEFSNLILHEDDIKVTPASVPGPDLWLSPATQVLYPFVIECKNVEKLNIWEALTQCESHLSTLNRIRYPVLFFKRNRSELYVALKARDFIKLMCGKKECVHELQMSGEKIEVLKAMSKSGGGDI